MKKLKWIALILVALVVVAVAIVLFSLDGIVRSTVETQASSSLNLPTTLGGANISLLGGSVSLKDLNIGSPPGFTAPQMFSLGGIGVQVDYSELRKEPIHINTITIDKPKLVLEQKDGKLNIQALSAQSSKEPAPASSDGKKTEPIRLIINKLTVTGVDVVIRPGIPGLPEEYPVSVPTVDVDNVGNADGNQNGAAIKDVAMQVMNAIAAKAADSPGLPPAVKAVLGGGLDKISGQAKEDLTKAADALKSGDKDALKQAGKDLKGLFKDPTKGN